MITSKLLEALRRWVSDAREHVWWSHQHALQHINRSWTHYPPDGPGEEIGPPVRWFHVFESWWWMDAAIGTVRGFLASRKCRKEGHRWEDAGSYAGPDSGAEHFACARCGDSFHHTYY